MENKKEKNNFKKEESDEKYEEKEELRQSDLAKGDTHSTFELNSEPLESEEEYYDTGIKPHVKLPPDESDEWPLIIPEEKELKKEEKEEKGNETKKESEAKINTDWIDWVEEDEKDKEELRKSDFKKGDNHSTIRIKNKH
jgi:hypothetical protein